MKITALIIILYCYLIGSFLYIPGSVLLYWPEELYASLSTAFFIVASAFFLLGAIVDLYRIINDEVEKRKVLSWIVLCLYINGGTAFVIGSFLFWPTFHTSATGYWIFRVGSLSYMTGGILIIINLKPPRKIRKILSIVQYMGGSCLFIIGGILSQTGQSRIIYSTIWIVASIAFTGGALLGLKNYHDDISHHGMFALSMNQLPTQN